jgi:hypothetical protein
MNFFAPYLQSLVNSVKVGYKTNAFAPLVWFSFIIVGLLFLFGYLSSEPLNYFLFGLGGIVILFDLVMYIVLLNKDPKLLQSENYRLEDKKLEILQEKGGKVVFNPVTLTPTETLDELEYKEIEKEEN